LSTLFLYSYRSAEIEENFLSIEEGTTGYNTPPNRMEADDILRAAAEN